MSVIYLRRTFIFYIDTKHKQMHDTYCDELISKSNAQLHTHNATLTTSKSKCQDNIIILKKRRLWPCVIFGIVLCLSYRYWCAITNHLCSIIHDWSFKISNVHQIIQEIAHKISFFCIHFHLMLQCKQKVEVTCHVFTNDNHSHNPTTSCVICLPMKIDTLSQSHNHGGLPFRGYFCGQAKKEAVKETFSQDPTSTATRGTKAAGRGHKVSTTKKRSALQNFGTQTYRLSY